MSWLITLSKVCPKLETWRKKYDPNKTRTCRHNRICYYVEYGFVYTFTIDAMKKIRKEFEKQTKAKVRKDKIQNEIAKLAEEGFSKDWGDY